MKYLCLNQNGLKENLIMDIGGGFIGTEYPIKVMDNLQYYYRPKKVKRFRSAFTTDQLNYLEEQFKKSPYVESVQRREIAATLNISERAIKIWYQNRRMKGKKESTNKDDDEQGLRKYLEFKNQLHNVTAPAANKQPQSLTLLTHSSQGNCYIQTNNFSCTRQSVESKDIALNPAAPFIPSVVTTAKVINPPSVFVKTRPSSPNFKTSAEFSIELCKKYKTESLVKSSNAEVLSFKKEAEDIKQREEPKPMGFTEQTTPEDLSLSRKMKMTAICPQQTAQGNASSNQGLVSLIPTVSPFYTQPYASSSGVIWKPLNVVPVVTSSSSPISAPSNSLLNISPVQANFTKKPCNCDCHVSQATPQVPYNFPEQSPNPQYIITAVPFQNTSTKL